MLENVMAFVVLGLGILCLITGKNMLKMIIGIEIIVQAITISFINGGYIHGNLALGQSMAITVIAIDVVIVAIGLSLIVLTHRLTKRTDVDNLTHLKF